MLEARGDAGSPI